MCVKGSMNVPELAGSIRPGEGLLDFRLHPNELRPELCRLKANDCDDGKVPLDLNSNF